MMRILSRACSILLFTMFLGVIKLVAQDQITQEPLKKLKHSIGAGAGFTTGYGLSYRYRPGKFGVQVNFAPYHDKETTRYSAGVTLIYTLMENKISNFYLYQGNHYYYNSEMTYVYNPDLPTSQDKERVTEGFFNNGLGFGIEFIILRQIGFNLMAGYASYKNFEQLNVTGEVALYYKF